MLQIQVSNPSPSQVDLTSLTLTASGSGIDTSGIASLYLYVDSNQNGMVDGGESLLVGGNYTIDNGTLTLTFNDPIGAGATKDYLVVYNFSGTASGTFQVGITSNNNATGTGGSQVQFTGAPIAGSTLTVSAATATATNTATSTGTSSPTQTATVTSTETLGITPGKTPTPIVFPNPAPGPTVNILPPPYVGIGHVKVELFTVAFRKILQRDFDNIPSGTKVSIELRDNWGRPLASGIYYVVVTTNAGRSTGKLMVLR